MFVTRWQDNNLMVHVYTYIHVSIYIYIYTYIHIYICSTDVKIKLVIVNINTVSNYSSELLNVSPNNIMRAYIKEIYIIVAIVS